MYSPLTSLCRASHTRPQEQQCAARALVREDTHEAPPWPSGAVRAALAVALAATAAQADIKIGVIYDYTGPFAGGGSKAAAIGNKIAIDMINEKGGVEGHKIVADLRRRAVQDRRRHQRGRAAAQRRQGRPADGRLSRAPIACRWPPRSTPPRSSCGRTSASPRRCSRTRTCNTCSARRSIPTSSARPPARSSPRTPRPSSARRSRTSRSPSSTRTAPTASASPWATRPSARSSACRSCTRRATRPPRPTSPRW